LEKQICENCGKECIKHAKGMCTTCYKKLVWKPKSKICKRCKRDLPHHAKGLCSGCYQTVFQLDNNKAYNYKKWHNISLELYKKITERCFICDFNKIIELHHLDGKKENNLEINLIGLCPNHHKMIHNYKFREEVFTLINNKRKSLGLKPIENSNIFIQNNPRK